MPRSSKSSTDYVLLSYFTILLVFGLLMLTSASAPIGYAKFGDKYYFIKRQLLIGVIPGVVAFFVASKIKYNYLKNLALPTFAVSLILLVFVFVPGIGSSLGTGASSWLLIGNYSFQPAEFAKLGLILFMAMYLAKKGRELQDFQKGFLVALALGIIPIGLVVLQPDVGTASILFSILFGILFVAGAEIWHVVTLAASGILGFAIMIAVAPYRAARFTTFLHPELDPLGIGYHINQAFLAIGSGGLFGLGLGHSRQKFEYIPEVHADSIFAIISEEMGFVFAAGLVILLLLICYRGFELAKNTSDQFGRILVSGILIWFLVQSFLNIGAMVGILPITGVPLPFVSHGGTALVIAMGAVGLLVNVSKNN